MENIRRPKSGETFEEILNLQDEFKREKSNKNVLSVSIKKMHKKKDDIHHGKILNELSPRKKNFESATNQKTRLDFRSNKFMINLEEVSDESATVLLNDVQERNQDFLNNVDRKWDDKIACEEYCKEDGFPEVLDLSRYFRKDPSKSSCLQLKNDQSIFAAEFDRLCGNIEENIPSTSVFAEEIGYDAIDLENSKKIERMTKDEVLKAQQEILERFDAKSIEFLLTRAQIKQKYGETRIADKQRLFPYKNKSQEINNCGKIFDKDGSKINVEEKIKLLEFFSINANEMDSLYDNMISSERLRFATEALHLDMTAKYVRNIVPRQEKSILKLFDSLRIPSNLTGCENDELIEKARKNLPLIKGLFLKEMTNDSGNVFYKFPEEINPITHSSWTLFPIRKVLDVHQTDGRIAAEDVIIVRLSLLWTLLLFKERPSVFYMFTGINEFYIRLAEIFLLGPQVFQDDCICACINRLLREFLIPYASNGLLAFGLTDSIAGLDAFIPFYEELLQRFEEFSMGNDLFTLIILIGAYLNSNILSGLLMKSALWSYDRNVVRQMTLKKTRAENFLEYMEADISRSRIEVEDKYYAQYATLLGLYARAIRDSVITRERNELVFYIASVELGLFVKVHSENDQYKIDLERKQGKEFQALISMIRKSVNDKLSL